MDPIISERESLLDLKQLLDRSQQYQASVLVMGGWAVSAFVGRHRYTKDIDLISTNEDRGALTAAMKELGYETSDRSFGFKGIRASQEMEIKLDVAVDRILDESRRDRPLVYNPGKDAWQAAPVRTIRAFHPENEAHQPEAPILPVNDLLIAKILPVDRANDVLDVASLVLSVEDQVRPVAIAKQVAQQREDVRTEFRARLQDLATRYRDAAFRQDWQAELGRRLSDADQDKLRRFLLQLDRLV